MDASLQARAERLAKEIAGEARTVEDLNGLMRLMQFSPSNSVIRVTTYSPWLNAYQTDSDSPIA